MRAAADFLTVTPADVLGRLTDIEIKYAPPRLHLLGNLELLKRGPRVSIVGSREASADGLKSARQLARTLAEHDIIVVSGLARGIDRAAHEGSIEASGQTVAVLGTPLDQVYPKENAELQEQLARDYLVVSQFEPRSLVHKSNFPARNRTMALLTDATIIVEAGETSGTLHQGWEALRLGRILFLMENVANDANLSWPAKMIHHGAQVLSRSNLSTVIRNMPAVTSSASIAIEA
jgi:DNA processing protein